VKLHEAFEVGEPVATVWKFFEQPQSVASCMPGVEEVRVIDDDNVDVRATQSIGPMSATFEARVEVLERVTNELIRFQATGKSVKGATGHIRTTNEVRLSEANGTTTVTIDGDVILAGALGAVGQKIVAKQAGKVTAQFAENLQSAFRGEPPRVRETATSRSGSPASTSGLPAPSAPSTDWSRIAAVMSAISAVLSLIAIIRSGRRAR
jgi:carbon monoxide dehydrogenase subunit G